MLIAYVDDNPDLPVAVASLPNKNKKGPIASSKERFQSVIKPRKGMTSNQIMFDDKPDMEQLSLNGKNAINLTAGGTATHFAKEGHQIIVADAPPAEAQSGEFKDLVYVDGTRSVSVTADEVHNNKGNYTQTVKADATQQITGNATQVVKGASKQIVQGGHQLYVQESDSMIQVDGELTIVAKAINLIADEGEGSVYITGANVTTKGDSIAVNGETDLSLNTGELTISSSDIIKRGETKIN